MRFASLGSGSRGNALVVEAGSTRLLIDCGFSVLETERRLARLRLGPGDLDAILVTHEHADHYGSAGRFSARHRIPVHLSTGTLAAAAPGAARPARHRTPPAGTFVCFDAHACFSIGDIEIHPYPVPHDAREPTQFVLGDGARRIGLLTDAGCITPHMQEMFDGGCDALLVESNHDPEMLANGPYPAFLKERVGGRYGHLSNGQAAEFILSLDRARLQHVIGMHISERNNTPAHAAAALCTALDCTADEVALATQSDGFGWRSVV